MASRSPARRIHEGNSGLDRPLTAAIHRVKGRTARARQKAGDLLRQLAGNPAPTRSEWVALGLAMALGTALVVAYALATRHQPLVGDEPEFDMQGQFFTMGKWWWSTTPFGIPHESMWKAPLYPLWVGGWYELLGSRPARVEVVQALCAPVTIALTWMLARRLFTPGVAIASAFVVAVFPLIWLFYGGLYAEALAIPLTMAVLFLALTGPPTPRRAVAVGVLCGLTLLTRPTSFVLFAAVLTAWGIRAGWLRGLRLTILSAGCALLLVLPWTVRNYVVTDGGFVPISVQDGAAAGTFNDDAANDPIYPWAWRPNASVEIEIFGGRPVDDAELRSKLLEVARDYVKEHPTAVLEAFYWNGLSRLWDVRRPGRAVDEAPFEGRSKVLTAVGLAMYYPLLVLALVGLWVHRRRRDLVVPLLALALTASVVFMVASGTRYRAPFEPLIVILACSLLVPRVAATRQPGADG
jgi:hypothetical protein